MDEDEMPEGEYQELPDVDDDVEIEDTPDGGAIVRMTDTAKPAESEFYANLAEKMDASALGRLGTQLIDLIGKDKEARKKRDEQYEEGIRRTGLGDDAPGGASFEGANKVVHPVMTEACVDFAARAMKEIFPPSGPVKDHISGKMTAEKIEKAKRKSALLNWQMTVQCPEVRAELEQLVTQLPLGGGQYLKLGWDAKRNRPTFLFVPIDNMLLPYAATNFYTAQRKTEVQYLTQLDYETRVRDGMYRDVDLTPVSMEPEQSVAGVANDKIEGRSQTSYNEDGLRTVYEVYAMIEMDGDDKADGPAPYIISVDKTTGSVLSVYRNWDEDDETMDEMYWYVEWSFIPWRGAYPIGLPHMIGGLSGAATGALRALLDSAMINNSQTMLKLKGAGGGQTIQIQPGQIEELEGGLNVDDIRKLAMPLPYNPPSPVLFSLLGFLVDTAKGVVRTSMDDIADGNPNAPVGTTLAKLEQGAVVYSAIHSRSHDSMARMLRILDRLNSFNLDDEKLLKDAGEQLATREDFDGALDVVPVSDPNIFSEAQRFAQIQAVAQRAAAMPGMYNMRKVEERILDTLKIANSKDLLNPAMEPTEQNAVNENVAASLGRPVTAFPNQDHLAHLETHISYLMNPMFGMSSMFAPVFIPAILNHIKEHLALWYASTVFDVSTDALGGDLGDMMRDMDPKDEEGRKEMDRMLAEASTNALGQSEEIFSKIPQVIQQAQQVMQQMQQQQPMPQDPRLALEGQKLQAQQQKDSQDAQLRQQESQQDAQTEQQRLQLEAQKLQQQQVDDQADGQMAAAKLQADVQIAEQDRQAEDQRTAFEVEARRSMNQEDNQTAMALAQAEIESGERFAVSTGTGINP